MKKILLHITILFLLASCQKKEKTNFQSGILWKIESKNGIESYILGTIHLYPNTEMNLSKNVISALEDCNVLALERDVTNQSEQQKFVDFQMPDFLLESYRVIIAEYGDNLTSMEGELMEIAQSSKIDLTGLESTDEILDILRTVKKMKIPENAFIKEEMLSDYKESLKLYKSESIGQFHKNMRTQMGEEITRILVDKRNENWIDNIKSLIETDKTFIAVGMGHLGGENGILNLLKENDYKIEPTKIENTPPNNGSYET